MKNIERTVWGIALIAVGAVWALNILGVVDIDLFFSGWWTLFIIVPCFAGLFGKRSKLGNLIGLTVGVCLLLCCQNVLSFELLWKLAIPVILVIIGVSFVFKDFFGGKISKEINRINRNKNNSEDGIHAAVFSGNDIKISNKELKNMTLDTTFGGIKLDIREAIINEDTVINCTAVFGGIDIFVPENINVEVKSTSIFGGVDNKRESGKENCKTVYINATCIFGGVEIK